MPSTASDLRHDDADTRPVAIERSDAIDAAGALRILADRNRRFARKRENGGEAMASYRRSLRNAADVYDAAADRIQRVCDNAF